MLKEPGAIVLSLVVAAALACGHNPGHDDAPDSLATATTTASERLPPAGVGAASTTATACPPTGLWASCSVQKRLERAGFVLQKLPDSARQPSGFSVRPTSYRLGRATLYVFLYPDQKSLEKDWKELDSATASPRGKPAVWPAPATLIRSANLAVLFITESAEQAERLTLAITAGAPQPAPREAKPTVLPAIRTTSTPPKRSP
jgi:hypothetical protein